MKQHIFRKKNWVKVGQGDNPWTCLNKGKYVVPLLEIVANISLVCPQSQRKDCLVYTAATVCGWVQGALCRHCSFPRCGSARYWERREGKPLVEGELCCAVWSRENACSCREAGAVPPRGRDYAVALTVWHASYFLAFCRHISCIG